MRNWLGLVMTGVLCGGLVMAETPPHAECPDGQVLTQQGECFLAPAAQPANNCPSATPYCKDIQTCDEAIHLLNDCGFDRLDSDGDGSPCETLCGDAKP